MSKENVIKFMTELGALSDSPKNAALKEQLARAKTEEEFTKLTLAEGPKAGFSFTAADVKAALTDEKARRKAQGKAMPYDKGQLSDKQLEGVAGGVAVVAPLTDLKVKEEGTIMCPW